MIPGTISRLPHASRKNSSAVKSRISFPAKANPLNRTAYSARSPRRIAMQYKVKPAESIMASSVTSTPVNRCAASVTPKSPRS